MAIPNRKHAIEEARALYPEAWNHCHVAGDPRAWDFIILAARYLQTQYGDSAFTYGLNAKRGNTSDPNMDVIYVLAAHETDGVFDAVANAGIDSATPAWNYQGPGENTTSGYLDPFKWETYDEANGGQPPKPPEPPKPVIPSYESLGGDATGRQIGAVLESDYARGGQILNAGSGAWFSRTYYDAVYGGLGVQPSIDKHRAEWCAALGVPVI